MPVKWQENAGTVASVRLLGTALNVYLSLLGLIWSKFGEELAHPHRCPACGYRGLVEREGSSIHKMKPP
jgi:hypothetical protein